ncbi:hypothetical protein [Streptomyces sp. NPDC126499]|uniref:hypothetical protein n=1 Tax=Streptomyces sp. NPDC126499 TaxID=3155314 RepID=UPI00332769B1
MHSTRPTADTIEPTPGLLAYQEPGSNDWRLAHHSGLVLAYCRNQQHAEDTAHLIADWVDWTMPADPIRSEIAVDGESLQFLLSYEASATAADWKTARPSA